MLQRHNYSNLTGNNWNWKNYSSGFKDSKLYFGDSDRTIKALRGLKGEADRAIILGTDFRAWCISPTGGHQGIKCSRLSLNRIVNLATKWDVEGRENPYKLWCETVGWDNIKLALKFRNNDQKEEITRRFKDKFFLQMAILQRICKVEGYAEVCNRFPAMAMLMAYKDLATCRRLLKKSDKQIILSCIDPIYKGTSSEEELNIRPWHLRVLRKIKPKADHYPLECIIYHVVTNGDKYKYLTHLHTINQATLALLDYQSRKPTVLNLKYEVFKEFASYGDNKTEKGEKQARYNRVRDMVIDDIKRMQDNITARGGKYPMPPIKSRNDITEYHDQLVSISNKLKTALVQFPKPIYEGTENIIPITDSHQLTDEGIKMKHCVGSYVNSAVFEERCFYHVQAEIDGKLEEATLELKKDNIAGNIYNSPRVKWTIGQLYSYCNAQPHKELRKIVIKWYNSNQTEISDKMLIVD